MFAISRCSIRVYRTAETDTIYYKALNVLRRLYRMSALSQQPFGNTLRAIAWEQKVASAQSRALAVLTERENGESTRGLTRRLLLSRADNVVAISRQVLTISVPASSSVAS